MDIDITTIVIIAANVLISFKGFKDFGFFERYKFQIGGIQRGEKDRMFTSGFLHVDEPHLIFNMLTLYFFAGNVISGVGSSKFLLIYLASLLSGSLFALWFHRNEYYYSAVGASGAVMGILYAAILLDPSMDIYLMFLPIGIPGYIFGIVYLLYSIYGMKARKDNIGHTAHFGGAVGGYVLTLLFKPELLQTDLKMVLLLALPIVLLFVLMKMGKL
ncbi:rhomboid family intramembrane serine protease [Neptunitalea lumnitzerae]|uniref:Rhomboid family intramembrane serine protease n=1 Tax=Neptunitalea lumnitzerae TaxID=2965509 RepID=A0ABQ5MLB9_9FLAO|nr:rhomboid family intramembrane serine protease [Neptunitalea sp. Y10]GLB50163.1 rhomboid family intramembrane serine protease [Neptunitalea sp. Y10]